MAKLVHEVFASRIIACGTWPRSDADRKFLDLKSSVREGVMFVNKSRAIFFFIQVTILAAGFNLGWDRPVTGHCAVA